MEVSVLVFCFANFHFWTADFIYRMWKSVFSFL